MSGLAVDGSDVPREGTPYDSRAPRPPRATDGRRASVLAALPPAPWLVYARAMLAEQRCDVIEAEPHGQGVCLVEDDADLVVVLGRPGARSIRWALAGLGEDAELVAHPGVHDHVLEALPRWEARPAVLYGGERLRPDASLRRRAEAAGARATLLQQDQAHGELRRLAEDPGLGSWIARVARRAPVAVVACAEGPCAFATAPYVIDGRFDVTVDTLPSARRRGLAACAAVHLAEALGARGATPLWGAVQGNDASHALAVRLGLAPVDELLLVTKTDRREPPADGP